MKRSGKKGFTLIELIIVIVIIGILAVISVPMYRNYTMKAMATEGVALAGAIRSAQRVYMAAHNVYTANYSDLDMDTPDGKYFTGVASIDSVNNGGLIQVHGSGDATGIYVRMALQDGVTTVSYDNQATYKNW